MEYALAKLVIFFGVRAGATSAPAIHIAATLAGVFGLQTAIKTVSLLRPPYHESPPGAMVAVALGPDDDGTCRRKCEHNPR